MLCCVTFCFAVLDSAGDALAFGTQCAVLCFLWHALSPRYSCAAFAVATYLGYVIDSAASGLGDRNPLRCVILFCWAVVVFLLCFPRTPFCDGFLLAVNFRVLGPAECLSKVWE